MVGPSLTLKNLESFLSTIRTLSRLSEALSLRYVPATVLPPAPVENRTQLLTMNFLAFDHPPPPSLLKLSMRPVPVATSFGPVSSVPLQVALIPRVSLEVLPPLSPFPPTIGPPTPPVDRRVRPATPRGGSFLPVCPVLTPPTPLPIRLLTPTPLRR